jgi:hypothetical protein
MTAIPIPRTKKYNTLLKWSTGMIVCCMLFSACRNNAAEKYELTDASPYFAPLMQDDDASVWRGMDFKLTADEIKKLEKAKLYETTPDHLFYEFSYPDDSTALSEYANIQYFFNENGLLDIITADIYLNDSAQQDKLYNTFSQYYTLRYGDPETDDNNYLPDLEWRIQRSRKARIIYRIPLHSED